MTDAQAHHWLRGLGTARLFVRQRHFERWGGAGQLERTSIALRLSAAVLAQHAVWLAFAPMLGVGAGVVRLVHGNEAACRYLALHYLPLKAAMHVVGASAQLGAVLAVGKLAQRLFRAI